MSLKANTDIREKLRELEIEFLHGVPVRLGSKAVDQILAVIVDSLPKLKEMPPMAHNLVAVINHHLGYNQCLKDVLGMLEGRKGNLDE